MNGRKLRERRKKLGLTMEQLADETGYSKMHIYRMEKGIRKVSARIDRMLKWIEEKEQWNR